MQKYNEMLQRSIRCIFYYNIIIFFANFLSKEVALGQRPELKKKKKK